MGIETKIQNSHLLTDIFGYFPSFHDAEVLRMTLDRGDADSFKPSLQATIHVFHVTPEIDERRRYVLTNHVLATFRFREIVELSLADFNHQNVLQRLSIVDISDRQLERVKFQVLMDGIHGVTAEFQCRSVSVESVEP
jgi:hypothetical protein